MRNAFSIHAVPPCRSLKWSWCGAFPRGIAGGCLTSRNYATARLCPLVTSLSSDGRTRVGVHMLYARTARSFLLLFALLMLKFPSPSLSRGFLWRLAGGSHGKPKRFCGAGRCVFLSPSYMYPSLSVDKPHLSLSVDKPPQAR